MIYKFKRIMYTFIFIHILEKVPIVGNELPKFMPLLTKNINKNLCGGKWKIKILLYALINPGLNILIMQHL